MKVKRRKEYVKYPKDKPLRKLLKPYSSYYSKGYFTNNCGRLVLSITKMDGKFKVISYSKYLWEIQHKRKVKKGYEVDHIDNDCTNDIFRNLQEITSKENRAKGTHLLNRINNTRKKSLFLWCPICNEKFLIYKSRVNIHRMKSGKEFHFCCRSCQVKAQHLDYKNFEIQKFRKVKLLKFTKSLNCISFKSVSRKCSVKLTYGTKN